MYAIHCVCYGISANCEEFTNNFGMYCIAKYDRNRVNYHKQAVEMIKRFGFLVLCLVYSSSFLCLFVYHGKVPCMDCLPWMLIYCMQSVSLLLYESMKSGLSCASLTQYIKFGGLFGILVRVPYIFVMFKLGWGMIGLATACILDFFMRGVYFTVMLNKYDRKNGLYED